MKIKFSKKTMCKSGRKGKIGFTHFDRSSVLFEAQDMRVQLLRCRFYFVLFFSCIEAITNMKIPILLCCIIIHDVLGGSSMHLPN